MTLNYSESIPPLVKGDSYKFKQVLLNLLHQSLAGAYKGSFKIMASMSYHKNNPYANVEIESSQNSTHKAESDSITKLTEE